MTKTEAQNWTALVLAAGEGKRMKSALPKVLHEVAGTSMVCWVVDAALAAGASDVVVVIGHARTEVGDALSARYGDNVRTVVQEKQNGTGDAVRVALPSLRKDCEYVTVLYGDCPSIPAPIVQALVKRTVGANAAAGLITAHLKDPTGYGRIVRDKAGAVAEIVEHRDCKPEQRAITEVNPGIYTFSTAFLRRAIADLNTDNSQGELYLTDVIEAAARTRPVVDIAGDMNVLAGVNDRLELANASAAAYRRIADSLAKDGVGMRDPSEVYIDKDVKVESDAFIDIGVHLRGKTEVATGAMIDTGCVLTDVIVKKGATILPYTVAQQSVIGEQATVGPFSHLRQNTTLGDKSKVGNFSETKNTRVGPGSKVNHLSYVGDGEIGSNVNIGAGTIFCNYDGQGKHVTTLEDDVFIGSDSQLVAPVTVGKGAYVASGTTVTKDVPSNALAIARTKQENKDGYASRLRATRKKK